MLEKLVFAALGKGTLEQVVRQELERLEQGGFVGREELERLSRECVEALQGRVERARGVVGPVLGDLGARVREALDLPSRAEVLALTEALKHAPAGDAAPAAPEAHAASPPPPAGAR